MTVSGKLVIICIVSLAMAGAGASWWFRYAATNQAARFWGPVVSSLIRDARTVKLYRTASSDQDSFQMGDIDLLLDTTPGRDISRARGLTHLRNALLEDRSYDWPPQVRTRNDQWQWALLFRDPPSGDLSVLVFSPDARWVTRQGVSQNLKLSSEPIAAGLTAMFDELTVETQAR